LGHLVIAVTPYRRPGYISCDEQEDAGHEDERGVAGNLFSQLRERANVQQHSGSNCDKRGTDQAGDRFRGGHLVGLRSEHYQSLSTLATQKAFSRQEAREFNLLTTVNDLKSKAAVEVDGARHVGVARVTALMLSIIVAMLRC
jgi:hypothetical protein